MKIVNLVVHKIDRTDPRFPPDWGGRPCPTSDLYRVEVELDGGVKKECAMFVPNGLSSDDLTPAKARDLLVTMGAVVARMERQEISEAT
jgi:hypothetical protein